MIKVRKTSNLRESSDSFVSIRCTSPKTLFCDNLGKSGAEFDILLDLEGRFFMYQILQKSPIPSFIHSAIEYILPVLGAYDAPSYVHFQWDKKDPYCIVYRGDKKPVLAFGTIFGLKDRLAINATDRKKCSAALERVFKMTGLTFDMADPKNNEPKVLAGADVFKSSYV